MCGGDTPDFTPGFDNEDVKDDNALSPNIGPSDGANTLQPKDKDAKPYMEAFDARHFPGVFDDVKYISNDSPPSGDDQIWRDVGNRLHTLVGEFQTTIKALKAAGGWEGKTIEAAYDNAIESINEPFYTGTAALRAAELTRKWREVVQFVVDKLVNDPKGEYDTLLARYNHDIEWKTVEYNGGESGTVTTEERTTEGDKATVNQQYDEYMRIVMKDSYQKGTESIWTNYPQFVVSNAADKPGEIPGLPEIPDKPTHTPTGDPSTGGGGPGLPSGGGGGGMSIPKSPGLSLPEGLQKQTQLPSDLDNPGRSELTDPSLTDPSPTDPSRTDPSRTNPSLTDPSQATGLANGLASGASQALGSAMQAAKAPPGGLPKNPGAKPKMPEGALQLGKGGPSSGAGRTGGGGGASLGGAPKGLPLGLPAAATQAAAAGASQTGTGAGAPGMGPPGTPGGAGQGAGGAQQAKEHKINKALRNRKTGAEIAGAAEAVVPVIGQDQDQDQGQDQQEDRRQRDELGQARHDRRGAPPPHLPERGERGVRAH